MFVAGCELGFNSRLLDHNFQIRASFGRRILYDRCLRTNRIYLCPIILLVLLFFSLLEQKYVIKSLHGEKVLYYRQVDISGLPFASFFILKDITQRDRKWFILLILWILIIPFLNTFQLRIQTVHDDLFVEITQNFNQAFILVLDRLDNRLLLIIELLGLFDFLNCEI